MKILVCTTPFIIFVWGQGGRKLNSFVWTAKEEELNNWHCENRMDDPCSRSTMDYNGLRVFGSTTMAITKWSLDVPHSRGDPNYIQVLG